ncbi:MAG: acyltransferase 3, partial [Verrucomicrobiales bacterium]|nr:acyltransferase 3 [Verrucomicrobiales bacterium]
ERLALTLHALQTHTRRIILLTQPPLLPPSAERSAIRAGSRPPFFEAAADRDLRQQCNNSVKKMSGSGIDVLDIDPLFTNPDGGILTITPAGRDVFHDKVHLSTDGAALLTPLLDPLLTPPQSAAPLSLP